MLSFMTNCKTGDMVATSNPDPFHAWERLKTMRMVSGPRPSDLQDHRCALDLFPWWMLLIHNPGRAHATASHLGSLLCRHLAGFSAAGERFRRAFDILSCTVPVGSPAQISDALHAAFVRCTAEHADADGAITALRGLAHLEFAHGLHPGRFLAAISGVAMDSDAPLMLDANCAYSVAEAKRLAAQVADSDIAFFEEPLRGNDIRSLAELRRATHIPLASGQMIQSVAWFRDVLAAGALDILQPNAAFCGGITAMLRILALAEVHGVPVTGAGGFEAANLPVMAGHAHGGMLEVHGAHVALKSRFATHPEFSDGKLHVADVPGLGFSLKA